MQVLPAVHPKQSKPTLRVPISPVRGRASPSGPTPPSRLPTLSPLRASRRRRTPTRRRYTVLPGNNSRLVLQCFRHRRGWAPVPAAAPASAPAGGKRKGGKARGKPEGGGGDAVPCDFLWEMYRTRARFVGPPRTLLNHFEHNHVLVTKVGLFRSLQRHLGDVSSVVPETYVLQRGSVDAAWHEFERRYMECAAADSVGGHLWILKPAASSNRGNGIKVVDCLDDIRKVLRVKDGAKAPKPAADGGKAAKKRRWDSWIAQKYMARPLLVDGRKFDIRLWVLVVAAPKGGMTGYLYQDYYVRTSSKKYSLSDVRDPVVHLTNDAVQIKHAAYGAIEPGNKLSPGQFAELLDAQCPGRGAMVEALIEPRMKDLVAVTLDAVKGTMNGNSRPRCFELFGYDFMCDEELGVWLIEVNSNPCLELSSPMLEKTVPAMLEHVFQLAVDPVFPPPAFEVPRPQEGASKPGGRPPLGPTSSSRELVGHACGPNRFEKVFEV